MIKKSRLIVTMLLSVIAAGIHAQDVDNTFRFIDANGNPVANGSTINVYEVEDDPFGGEPYISTGLSVENTTGSEAYVSADVIVNALPNGSFQVCFPTECISGVKGMITTGNGDIAAGEKLPLNTEWIMAGEGMYGTATVTFKLKVMTRSGKFPNFKYAFKADGPQVTVNCVYADPAGIGNVAADGVTSVNIYDITGKAVAVGADETVLNNMSGGIYMVETMKDGKRAGIRKVVK